MSEGEKPIDLKDMGGKGPLHQDYANAYGMVAAWLKGASVSLRGVRVETYRERYTRRADLAAQCGIDPRASGPAIDAADRIVAEMNILLADPEANKTRLAELVSALDAIVYRGEIPPIFPAPSPK